VINLIHKDDDEQPRKKKKQKQKRNRNDDKDSTKLNEWRVILNTFSKFQMFTWSFHLLVIVIVIVESVKLKVKIKLSGKTQFANLPNCLANFIGFCPQLIVVNVLIQR
jgi:hypothetical protein